MKSFVQFLMLFVSVLFFSFQVLSDTPWSPNVRVSATTGNESTIAVTYPYIYVSYNSNPQRFRLSTDGGINWQLETNFPGSCCDGSMYTDELGYVHITVLFTSPAAVRYYRSTDNGTSWTAPITLNSGSPGGIDKNWTYNSKNRVYAAWVAYNVGTSEWDLRFAKSDDRGLTFSPQVQVNDGNNISYRQWALPREDPKDSNTIYVSMTWDRRNFGTGYSPPWQVFVAKSTNGGNNWLPNVALPDTGHSPQLIGNIPYSITSSVAVSPVYNDVYVVWVDQYTGVSGGKLNVFFSRSTNGGASFLPRVKLPAAPNPDTSYHFQPWIECDRYGTVHVIWYDTRGFIANSAGGRKGTYYTYSVDRGVSWAPEERVSDTTDIFSGFVGHYQSFTTDSLKLYSTWTDVRNGQVHVYYSWRPLPFITGIKNNNTNIVKSFKLNQNYPNPFNPMTTITYELPKPVNIILKVYDELGKEVKTLVNGMQNSGKYEVVWDASDDASGIYFYKLSAGNYSDTKRMILIK
jgi:hypothetical protein